ncbi:MAG: aminomethyl-transferring glycine dehydrogenase subunit GcvPA [Acetobacteraceae bacterium]|nr:aminomethyl-transferring glycine dehydrogenase subunit GcvPA [Acetobacteraceae bacterium]
MTANAPVAHPWMANSVPEIKRQMLEAIGASSIEELYQQIPEDHRYRAPLALPPTLSSEQELKRHLLRTLAKNQDCERNLSFLGAGCWQHHVPAICDELYRRTEWLHSVFGSPSSDHGRNQAWFEFASQLGELVGMEFVGLPVYSWGCALGHAARMASRITGRREILVPRLICPERLSVLRNYCEPSAMRGHIAIVEVGFDAATGRLDLADLRAKISERTAVVYIETPSYLGIIEDQGAEIARIAHGKGALFMAGVDPISLGVLAPPADYGADIVVGTTQTLGVHMNCGGGVGGFIATPDEERFAREYNTLNISIGRTNREGEYAFGLSLFHQSSYGMREEGKDWTGNSVYMWAVVNAVYMALLGPQGFRDVGRLILSRCHAAAKRIATLPGVKVRFPSGFFKEFVVDFTATGRTVAEINDALRAKGIFGGKDLSADFPEFGQSALYCVTEIHTPEDIARLHAALAEVLAR